MFSKIGAKKTRKKGSGATQLVWKIYKGSPRVKYFKLNLIFQKIGVKKNKKKGSGATQLEWKIYKGSPRVKHFKLN